MSPHAPPNIPIVLSLSKDALRGGRALLGAARRWRPSPLRSRFVPLA
jgi:hypothetical protein